MRNMSDMHGCLILKTGQDGTKKNPLKRRCFRGFLGVENRSVVNTQIFQASLSEIVFIVAPDGTSNWVLPGRVLKNETGTPVDFLVQSASGQACEPFQSDVGVVHHA